MSLVLRRSDQRATTRVAPTTHSCGRIPLMDRLEPREGKHHPALLVAIAAAAILLLLSLALFFRIGRLEEQLTDLAGQVEENRVQASTAATGAEKAARQASSAEENARLAALGRSVAETEAASARVEADQALSDATQARTELEQARQDAETELNRLHGALGKIVETRRTALGLVMNLDSDALEFDFDKAFLRPENRELLSRIAGILLTSRDYAIYVYGHTDDVGSDHYNLELSERRAQSVRDYIVEVGVDSALIETRGFGKTKPLAAGTSTEARARNRRVEIGIVNTHVSYTDTVLEAQQP